MPSPGQALSLGALFHHLRDGLADRGAARISMEFRLESMTRGEGATPASQLFVRRGFRAELTFQDEVLQSAHIVTTGMSPRPVAELLILRRDQRYLYSRDGDRFGLLIDTPRLFDVYAFESRLSRIPVRDVILDEDVEADGSPVNIARVLLDEEPFRDLIRLYGDDVALMSESLEEDGRSIVITAGTDVGVHYGWVSTGEEIVPGPAGVPERYASRHSSRVSIRLQPLPEAAAPEAPDPVLPELGSIDDVWAQARSSRALRPVTAGWRP